MDPKHLVPRNAAVGEMMVSGPKVYFLLDIATYFGVTSGLKLPFTFTRYTHNINIDSETICVGGQVLGKSPIPSPPPPLNPDHPLPSFHLTYQQYRVVGRRWEGRCLIQSCVPPRLLGDDRERPSPNNLDWGYMGRGGRGKRAIDGTHS